MGGLFEDREFPANANSLHHAQHSIDANCQWLRPGEMTSQPKFISDGIGRNDINQGALGDCWFLASVAAVGARQDLITKVLNPNQPLSGRGYDGKVTFQFWYYGKWIKVVIDDRIPCTRTNKPIFARSDDPNELWICLIEKPYAKLFGSYGAIEGGQPSDALTDLTGGVSVTLEIKDFGLDSTFSRMYKALRTKAMISASVINEGGGHRAEKTGIVSGHAYSIVKADVIEFKGNRVSLVCVHNPWGNAIEWKGAWSDKSREWERISDSEKRRLGFTIADDGQFWMAMPDFANQFHSVSICMLSPDFDGDGVSDKVQGYAQYRHKWIVGKSAGGCRNYLDTFATNPQYLLNIKKQRASRNSPDFDEDGLCDVYILLMQYLMPRPDKKKVERQTIGLSIYKVPSNTNQRLDTNFFTQNASLQSSSFINTRETNLCTKLEPGTYVVIPCTFKPNIQCDYLIRIFAEYNIEIRPL